ncbi:hypothetical protein RR48_12696 [Papilio machaon]|uniref:Uncharacterized protein n=1 Tax=Papilio machaon TaxID=76193 RepID=A0A194QR84_PAPMA|nr:hypothetical protein RR48_12696 [Papilio machaon]
MSPTAPPRCPTIRGTSVRRAAPVASALPCLMVMFVLQEDVRRGPQLAD